MKGFHGLERILKNSVWLSAVLLVATLAGCLAGEDSPSSPEDETIEEAGYTPRVIIGIPDSGINPYHEMYYRPDLVDHPSTYIEGFPDDVKKLDLSVGGDDYEQMFKADQDEWSNVETGQWYWIPQTVFVAVYCETKEGQYCILDDQSMHGTGTTSSALTENEEALFAFKAGGAGHEAFEEGGIPVDIYSVSWANIVPIAISSQRTAPIYVLAAGNDPRSILLDSWAGTPNNIVVGGASAQESSDEGMAGNQGDVVSYFCRPTADTQTASGIREEYCGTSFAAPTVAGALSKVIYEVRNATGYTGGLDGRFIDPIAGITIGELRDAMNRTATYDPEARYSNAGLVDVPLNPVAPWVQWSWGFYDGKIAENTIDHLTGTEEAPEKPMEAALYMEALFTARTTVYG